MLIRTLYAHTHTHTHTWICMYVCGAVEHDSNKGQWELQRMLKSVCCRCLMKNSSSVRMEEGETGTRGICCCLLCLPVVVSCSLCPALPVCWHREKQMHCPPPLSLWTAETTDAHARPLHALYQSTVTLFYSSSSSDFSAPPPHTDTDTPTDKHKGMFECVGVWH